MQRCSASERLTRWVIAERVEMERFVGGLLRVCPKAHDDAVDVVRAQPNDARCADEETVE